MGFSYWLPQGIARDMDVSGIANDLAEAMARQLRLKSGTLEEVTARAGNRLPRHLRADARTIIEAEAQAAHPKFAHRIDPEAVKRSDKALRTFLNAQDPRAERIGAFLDRLAVIVFIPFVIVLVAFLFALRQGYFD